MTKQDYELLVQWAGQNFISRSQIADLCNRLYEQNPRFKQVKFEERVQSWRTIEPERLAS